jgi:hypothetical protein
MGLVDTLIAQFQEQQARANEANELRYQEGLGLYDQVIEDTKSGGTFEKATEAGITRGRQKAVAQGTQSLVSSGLASTTTAAGLGKKFEEEVGQPARLRAQDVQSQRQQAALMGKAGFIERREDVGPSYSDIASLAKSIGAGAGAGAKKVQRPTFTRGSTAGRAGIFAKSFQGFASAGSTVYR